MSIILDALKKLDRERSGRPDGPPNIDTEILRPDSHPRRKKNQLYLAAIFLTAVVAAAITYAVVVWFGFPSKSGPPASMTSSVPKQPVNPVLPEASSPPKPGPSASVTPPAPKQQVKPAPPEASPSPKSDPPASVSSSASSQPVEPTPPETSSPPKSDPPASVSSSASSQPAIPDPPSHEPARASGEETRKEPSKIQGPPENKDPATSLGEKKGGQKVIPEKVDTAPGNKGKGAGPIPSGSAISPPSLRITAIGWDEDPSKRFAFVNGMMAHEGDIIEEAKIVEIYPKRIRFLHNGQYFEIRM